MSPWKVESRKAWECSRSVNGSHTKKFPESWSFCLLAFSIVTIQHVYFAEVKLDKSPWSHNSQEGARCSHEDAAKAARWRRWCRRPCRLPGTKWELEEKEWFPICDILWRLKPQCLMFIRKSQVVLDSLIAHSLSLIADWSLEFGVWTKIVTWSLDCCRLSALGTRRALGGRWTLVTSLCSDFWGWVCSDDSSVCV